MRLGEADSGLTIVGEPGAEISGGVALDVWRRPDASALRRFPASARPHLWEAAVPEGVERQVLHRKGFGHPDGPGGRRLIVQGSPQELARWPNPGAPEGGWLRIGTVTDYVGGHEITLPPEAVVRARTWRNHDQIWTFGYWRFDWADAWEPTYRWAEDRTTMMVPRMRDGFTPAQGRRFYFANVPEELDRPGEWWLDQERGVVVYWPRQPLAPGDAVITALEEPLFHVRNASDITFGNLVLRDGSGHGIDAAGGSNLTLENVEIRGFAKYGVRADQIPGTTVRRSHFRDLGESALFLSAGDRASLTSGNAVVEDNVFERFGQIRRTYKPGVALHGVGARIRHNRFYDATHSGIILNGNDHLIEANDFQKLGTETGDAGAVYMGRDVTMRGVVVRGNWFRDLGQTVVTESAFTEVMGLYLDDLWSGTTVENNIFQVDGTGLMIGGGRDNIVTGNLFLNCRISISVDQRAKGWAADRLLPGGEWNMQGRIAAMSIDQPPFRDRYPGLAAILGDDPWAAKGNVIRDNQSFGGAFLRLLDGLTREDVGHQGNIDAPDARPTLAEALARRPPEWPRIRPESIGPRTPVGVRR